MRLFFVSLALILQQWTHRGYAVHRQERIERSSLTSDAVLASAADHQRFAARCHRAPPFVDGSGKGHYSFCVSGGGALTGVVPSPATTSATRYRAHAQSW